MKISLAIASGSLVEAQSRKQSEISPVNIQSGLFDQLLYHKSGTKSALCFLFCKKL